MANQFLSYTERGAWQAPDNLWQALHNEFRFRDPDPLMCDPGAYYLEPPARRAFEYLTAAKAKADETGCVCVVFLRCDTDSKWWHSLALQADQIIFIRGRVPLVEVSTQRVGKSPVAASVIIVYGGERSRVASCRHPRLRTMKKVDGEYLLPVTRLAAKR